MEKERQRERERGERESREREKGKGAAKETKQVHLTIYKRIRNNSKKKKKNTILCWGTPLCIYKVGTPLHG